MPDGLTSSHHTAELALVRSIEERASNAWPALETRLVRGWLMRFSGGYTKRANSVYAWRPEVPLADIISHAADVYRSRGLPLVVRLTPLADSAADAMLAARGFARLDESIVMTAPLAATGFVRDSATTIASAPSHEWLDGFATANLVPASRRLLHDAMVSNIARPVAFARLDDAHGPGQAWGIGAVERDFVGLFDIVTAPSVRRQGAGRRLVGHMLWWARTQGATIAYLQVVATNSPAVALYRRLGFEETYRYHYRIAPG
ncbi:MAG: GNAT family N-acetyltransferase [Hyphomicrobiaceae bacterium]